MNFSVLGKFHTECSWH